MVNLRLLLSFFIFFQFASAQQTILIKNINFRASELNHYLNNSRDSLILSGQRKIYAVSIYNRDMRNDIDINAKNASIYIGDLPPGRYVSEVVLRDKRIILTLLKDLKNLELPSTVLTKTLPQEKKLNVTAITNPTRNTSQNTIKKTNQKTEDKSLTSKAPVEDKDSASRYIFWVERIINTGYSSKRITKMATLYEVEQLIKENKLELESNLSKNNVLIVWKVKDKENFMKAKSLTPNYLYTESEYFEFDPFYSSEDAKRD